MADKYIKIYGTLRNDTTTDTIALADQVLDEGVGMKQHDINKKLLSRSGNIHTMSVVKEKQGETVVNRPFRAFRRYRLTALDSVPVAGSSDITICLEAQGGDCYYDIAPEATFGRLCEIQPQANFDSMRINVGSPTASGEVRFELEELQGSVEMSDEFVWRYVGAKSSLSSDDGSDPSLGMVFNRDAGAWVQAGRDIQLQPNVAAQVSIGRPGASELGPLTEGTVVTIRHNDDIIFSVAGDSEATAQSIETGLYGGYVTRIVIGGEGTLKLDINHNDTQTWIAELNILGAIADADHTIVAHTADGTAVELGSGGSGAGFYNVTTLHPLASGYHTLATALTALQSAKIDDEAKRAMIITFETAAGKWAEYRFIGTSLGSFYTTAGWEEFGGGKVKSITVNGRGVEPDGDGNVAITFDTIAVDQSLDGESTNPVENKAVVERFNEVEEHTVYGVDVLTDSETNTNTLKLTSKTGDVIASVEFAGGTGGGESTASRIVISASINKTRVKEGEKEVMLTYKYDHLNADGERDGQTANITITISRGTTTTYQQTINNVAVGTVGSLNIAEYLLTGTVEVRVLAQCTTSEGTVQKKQAYASVNVVTLDLTSSYNLASAIAGGGYADGATIDIPYAITGSGTKEVMMYLDGNETPTSQTITRSGTTNGSFTIAASTLAPGRHTVQLVAENVAENEELRSDSIYIDILKAGVKQTFIGIKRTDPEGTIRLGDDHLTPNLTVGQYEQLEFNYVAYDPDTTPATVEEYQNGRLVNTLSVARSMQTYSSRFNEQGTTTIELRCGATTYGMELTVNESTLDIGEATNDLVFKLNAAGRSNSESNPAQWTSGDVTTSFAGFDWQTSGWTGEALKLMNGARAVINYQPFATDIKGTGLTIEITMRVTNILHQEADVITCFEDGEAEGSGKGLRITASEAAYLTGKQQEYTNEDGEKVWRDTKLSTKYICQDENGNPMWIKFALCIDTVANGRLMHLYVNGNRVGADLYDYSFSFQQENNPQNITIDSSAADVEVRSVRVYQRAISDDEELENDIIDSETAAAMVERYDENNILDENDESVSIDKLRQKGKGIMRIVRQGELADIYEANDKGKNFFGTVIFYSPFGEEYDFRLTDCRIRIQGTSSTKYPSKNLRIYFNKGGENLKLEINGVVDPYEENKYKMRENSVPMNLFCMKSDYSDSSMSLNTGGAKLFNDILKELGQSEDGRGYLTPPQLYQLEHSGSISGITIRQSIDGFPIDIFTSATENGESHYVGQYNFNNEKSDSGTLFGMEGLEGFTPACPICLETLNNTEPACLFQSEYEEGDDETATDANLEAFLVANFDDGMEFNYPADTYYNATTATEEKGNVANETQKTAIKRLFSWIHECIKEAEDTNGKAVTSDDISSFVSEKFVKEVSQYFSVKHLLFYYLWTDYHLSVDQRAKNILLRTWDGKIWYTTYYDGDTQHGKRNDCFLVYDYTTDRDTWDAEMTKYAFEGRDSWLWNLVLANLQGELKTVANEMRSVMKNERVLDMFINEQSGNWSDRAFNKSGELKYIDPALGKGIAEGKWEFIFALQGANEAHRRYLLTNRFALLDAKYGTSVFTSDNIDLYMNRSSTDAADVVKLTAKETYAFGYGTNNNTNIANTGIVQSGEVAQLDITGTYTVNDPLRIYGASRVLKLDMTSAADHLKNSLNLTRCTVLQEIDLSTEGTGSTAWNIVLDNCRLLRKINLKGQAQARTNSNGSTSLDLNNQTRLQYLNASGCTSLLSVEIAQGAPVTTLILPSSLTTLKLEYLPNLTMDGLTVENYESVQTFRFAACPNLDWVELLAKCTNVKRIRVTGIDMDGDGKLLDDYLQTKGVDSAGTAVEYCALVGTYRLTTYAAEDKLAEWREHYPELNIRQTPYTVFTCHEMDEKTRLQVSDCENITNHDNNTGYGTGKEYVVSGHLATILSKRHRVLAKSAGDGKVIVCQLDDKNSNYYADGKDANLTGVEGDEMNYEPHYWYKGISDRINQVLYACYCAEDNAPVSEYEYVRIMRAELSLTANMAVRIGSSYATLNDAQTTASGYSIIEVDVSGGWKQARWPSVNSAQYGALFLDADGNIVKRSYAYTGSGILDGMYCFDTVPDNAARLVFTISTNAPFDYVLLTMSDKPEDIEPDWVEHTECLVGTQETILMNGLAWSICNGQTSTATETQSVFKENAAARGTGWQIIDYEMHKDIANLFFYSYGTRNSQEACGAGTSVFGRILGLTNATGMQDTRATAYNTDAYDSTDLNAYVPANEDDDGQRTAIGSPNVMGYENWQGNKGEWMQGVEFNRNSVDYVWRITMPDGTERSLKGFSANNNFYITRIMHGRYMDILPSHNLNGSDSTYYADQCTLSNAQNRVPYRSGYNATLTCGVAFLNVSDSNFAHSAVGSRLAFRGEIEWAATSLAYKAAGE